MAAAFGGGLLPVRGRHLRHNGGCCSGRGDGGLRRWRQGKSRRHQRIGGYGRERGNGGPRRWRQGGSRQRRRFGEYDCGFRNRLPALADCRRRVRGGRRRIGETGRSGQPEEDERDQSGIDEPGFAGNIGHVRCVPLWICGTRYDDGSAKDLFSPEFAARIMPNLDGPGRRKRSSSQGNCVLAERYL